MEKEIGKNVSSGAKKVKRVQEEKAKEPKKTKRSTTERRTSERAVKREHAAADERVKAAKARAEKKEAKLDKKATLKQAKIEKKAAIKQKKLEKKQRIAEKKLARKEMIAKKKAERLEKRAEKKAALKEKRIEKRAERAARKELLKNESKAEKAQRIAREKKERIALKRKKQDAHMKAREDRRKAREAAHVRKAEERKHKREQRTERRRTGGFGGWLAAVISLGTACLVLATVVTAGAIRMNEMQVSGENSARATLYEMVSASEELDDSLAKLRVSSGANEQRLLLTNILVDAAIMESSLERIPVDQATSTDISAFVNRTGSYARTLLAKLGRGESLSETERSTVAYLYEVNDKLYTELNDLMTHMQKGELRSFVGGKQGTVSEKFGEMGNETKQEPEDIVDAPFTGEGNVGENRLARFEEISSSEAEERARELFAPYHVRDVKFTGETMTEEVSCYNFTLTDENDVEIFAEITKNGGKLAFFDTYEQCSTKNFDLETCDAIAREYLKNIGIEDVEAVWLSDAGMVANLTYTAVEDGVRIYPEIIRIRVCEEKGRVIGMDARGYLLNNEDRDLKAGLSEAEAEEKLTRGLEPYSANLALIPVDGREVLCWEFACKYADGEYIVYLDAKTGDEVQLFRVMNSAQGSYLR